MGGAHTGILSNISWIWHFDLHINFLQQIAGAMKEKRCSSHYLEDIPGSSGPRAIAKSLAICNTPTRIPTTATFHKEFACHVNEI